MQYSTSRSERITATISTVVAVIILAGGVTAYQSHNAPVEDVVQLESDFRFQLEVGFRHDLQERAARLEQLQNVSQAWEQSPRSDVDRQKLADWLLEATIRSMAGAVDDLPDVPDFGAEPKRPQLIDRAEPASNLPTVEQVRENATSEPTPAATLSSNAPTTTVPTVATTPSKTAQSEPTQFESLEVNPFADVALVESNPAKTVAASTSATRSVQPRPAPVRINLTELAARIAGYHEGLNEIERAVATLDANDFVALSEQLRLLEGMTRDFQFVKLYYAALTDAERRAIATPRTMAATLAGIERRLDQTQETLAGDFLGEFDVNHQDRVGALRQQLANISTNAK